MRNFKILLTFLFASSFLTGYCQFFENEVSHIEIDVITNRDRTPDCLEFGETIYLRVFETSVNFSTSHNCDMDIVIHLPGVDSYNNYDEIPQGGKITELQISSEDFNNRVSDVFPIELNRLVDCSKIDHLEISIFCGKIFEDKARINLCCEDFLEFSNEEILLREQKLNSTHYNIPPNMIAVYNFQGQQIGMLKDKSITELNRLFGITQNQVVILVESIDGKILSVEKYFVQ